MTNFIWGIIGIILLLEMLSHFGLKKDSTDMEKRSGLIIYTDGATGVQYLGTVFGSLTVRVDKDGKPYQDKPNGP